ncbi:MAG: right-handed parallel beta-helix repeat-containing protein, partial [Pseudomonadota bacterium]
SAGDCDGRVGQPRPVIDQGQSAAAATPTVGLLLDCVSHVIVRNIEIRQVNDAGITTSLDGCVTTDLRVESSHVHHVYGSDLVAGIRLANTSGARVRANLLHDIVREAGASTPVVVTAGATQDVLVQSNSISRAHSGVALRSAGHAVADVAITQNRLTDLETAVHAQADAGSAGSVSDVAISDNTIAGVASAVTAEFDRSSQQSSGLVFHNNTVVDTSDAALIVSGVDGLASYNNIFANTASDVLVTEVPRDPARVNSIDYIDNNLIWSEAGPYWTLSLGGLAAQRFVGLDTWRSAWSGVSHDDLIADPDVSSLFADPQFTNAAGGDYRTENPALIGAGRDGADIGARTDQ